MATKNYMINDKWLDLDKQNIVELQSVDGVLDSMKVNGSEIVTPSGKITITENGTDIDVAQYALADVNVEGGGGSSDFSTAVVTITGIGEGATVPITGCYCFNDYNLLLSFAEIGDGVYTVPLYKGTVVFLPDPDLAYTLSGNATDNDGIFITGDCTITIS